MFSRLFLLLSLSAALLTTCDDLPEVGDEEPEAGPSPTIGADELDEECPEVSAPEGAPAPVTMMDNFYEPNCVAVSSEQSVALTNAGNLDHNFTIQGTDVSFDVEPG